MNSSQFFGAAKAGEAHLIIEDVSWWKNVRLMLGFTQIVARLDKVSTRKLL